MIGGSRGRSKTLGIRDRERSRSSQGSISGRNAPGPQHRRSALGYRSQASASGFAPLRPAPPRFVVLRPRAARDPRGLAGAGASGARVQWGSARWQSRTAFQCDGRRVFSAKRVFDVGGLDAVKNVGKGGLEFLGQGNGHVHRVWHRASDVGGN